MLTPEIAKLVQLFYPLGNTPGVSLTQDLPLHKKADLLLLGCGDMRHILFTAHGEQEAPSPFQNVDPRNCQVDAVR